MTLQWGFGMLCGSFMLHYASLCCTSARTISASHMSQRECIALYSQSLTAAAALQHQSVKPATLKGLFRGRAAARPAQ